MNAHEADAILARMNARLDRVCQLEARMDRLSHSELAELVSLCQQSKADLAAAQAWADTAAVIQRAAA